MNRCLVLEEQDRVPFNACRPLTLFCGLVCGAAAIALALLLAGCVVTTPPRRYTVFVDPNVTDADEQPIAAAMASWQNVTGAAWLSLSYPAACPTEIQSGDICVRYGTDASLLVDLGGKTEETADGRAYVWLRSPVTLQTAAHELGHAQGIAHHQGAGTVMCATPECAAPDVTPADAVAWEEVR